ncbi:UDP-N-acetylglucosamine 2-epimerase (non-hydrolyzing) [Salicibibacter cibi]|uniref:UDP-N-acetylglucosamine 2-epimerase (non-hydrolyzing) n=1 Tax=Salicibibacter cibi TaxID=2743001 RepID=A0A7T7CGQ4_9BACI|nr:UDP-N-acetylglucosamine 2-epimerase (non-hydrolyzing) [Salicibibacter cibi]QQK81437.1 UDP-N-acetylglucosamine 2-epimerase (non-hydrolyzing) [Salicibibacter cibi]
MIKTMTIFGTRPEGIKMVPIVQALNREKEITNIFINTAQHRDMLDQVLNLFMLTPDYDLDIMREGQSLETLTKRLIDKLSLIIEEEKPDLVLVHGDTTTTFSGTYAGFLQKVPVGHVEAGLRTNDIYAPFPEEGNRQLVGRLATYHFAATQRNKDNLLKENIPHDTIEVVGNTVIDALMDISRRESSLSGELKSIFETGKKTILLTTHRRENMEALQSVYRAIRRIVDANDDVQVVFPVHKNPAIRQKALHEIGDNPDVYLIEPLDYEPFIHVLKSAYLVITDSGGIQEEAPGLGKPVLVARNTTERPEGVEAGTLQLVGTSEDTIVQQCQRLLSNKEAYTGMSKMQNPFGQGDSADKIVNHIKKSFDLTVTSDQKQANQLV